MRRAALQARLRRAMLLAVERVEAVLPAITSPREAAATGEHLARMHQMLDGGDGAQRTGSPGGTGTFRHGSGEGLRSRKGVSSGSSLKPARAVSLREGGLGETPPTAAPSDGCVADQFPHGRGPAADRQRSSRKPQPYDTDAEFLAFAASFPQGRRSGLPAAYRLWQRLDEPTRLEAIQAIAQEVAEAHDSGKPDALGFVFNIVKWLDRRPWEGRRLPVPAEPPERTHARRLLEEAP